MNKDYLLMDKAYLQMHFSRASASYDEESHYQYELGKKLMYFFPLLEKKSVKKILDVGCGTGKLSYTLSRYFTNAKIDAIDLSSGMIDFANKHYSHPNIDYHILDVEDLLSNKQASHLLRSIHSYDIIVSNAAFHWFYRLPGVLDCFSKLLARNGKILLTVYLDKTYTKIQNAISELNDQHQGVLSFPNKDKLIKMTKSANLKIIGTLEQESHAWFSDFNTFRMKQRRMGTYNIPFRSQNGNKQTLSYRDSKKLKQWLQEGAFSNPFSVIYHVAYYYLCKSIT